MKRQAWLLLTHLSRLREKEVEFLQQHGAEIIAVCQNLDDPNILIWMLDYRDRAHREEIFVAFRADPKWTALRQKYEVRIEANVFMMSETDYSALHHHTDISPAYCAGARMLRARK